MFVSPSLPVRNITNDLFSGNLFPSISRCSDSGNINFNTGLATSITYNIVQHEDRLVARERISNKRNNGKGFHDRIIDVNFFTGLYFNNG